MIIDFFNDELKSRAISALAIILFVLLMCFGPWWVSLLCVFALFGLAFYEIVNITKNVYIHFYTVFVFLACVMSFQIKLDSGWLLLHIFMITWAHDVGGYVFGKFFGGPKIAPTISPNKTWAGLGGGIALGVGVWLMSRMVAPSTPLWMIPFANFAGLAGDLVVSKIKRIYDLKDSSNLIPGHGGVLDRFDSFFAIVFFYYFMFF